MLRTVELISWLRFYWYHFGVTPAPSPAPSILYCAAVNRSAEPVVAVTVAAIAGSAQPVTAAVCSAAPDSAVADCCSAGQGEAEPAATVRFCFPAAPVQPSAAQAVPEHP